MTNYSVMIGANNEGKTNILHALKLGMNVIESFKDVVVKDRLGRIRSTNEGLLRKSNNYDWYRDFPVSKQNIKNKELETEITFEFLLNKEEIENFYKETGSKLNGTLPVMITLSKSNVEVKIRKQGRGADVFKSKTNKIADFISRNINFDYIPAIRTSEDSEEILMDLIARELSKLESNRDYTESLEKIRRLQEPVLKNLSDSVTKTISSFLPSVAAVHIDMPHEARYRAFRRGLRIDVDDGNKTPLEQKGDGVKSLVALALMRYASEVGSSSASSIVAVEEPEAHLHPQAIHELRDVLVGLAQRNQVILTSHSPLFVDPANLDSTIVIRESKATVAKDIGEVREVLGVRVSDNLQSARLVAIVEGDDDVIILKAFLARHYSDLRSAMERGDLVFDALGGASNLSYKVRMYRSSATMVQCFLDNDEAGRKGVQKALEEHLIREADYNLIVVQGQNESELEDTLDVKKYKEEFYKEFSVDPTICPPGSNKRKWSSAMEKKFQAHGKLWTDELQMKAKLWLAHYAASHIDQIVIEQRLGPLHAFARSLSEKVKIRS